MPSGIVQRIDFDFGLAVEVFDLRLILLNSFSTYVLAEKFIYLFSTFNPVGR